jgi:hypothetical protein
MDVCILPKNIKMIELPNSQLEFFLTFYQFINFDIGL